ncbi:ABC transporter substrate-binding protein [Leifsonia sp. F6_8S_P_1B]|uniref:ABC transporter substrate-binding protein n=1 Tax=Leifsonia williamsii TaxID=3035919 RepID=A0ABT8KFN8_9MICO|nr:ABC transporter substrate-binding protein [Leifsonia williamsii]MDN4615823.1 ABC transporter substrate-binding protein [Leifsonia williamsii]
MITKRARAVGFAAAATVVALSLAGCSAGASADSADSKKIATATDAASAGGMDALVKAAKAEGSLNIIATPGDWANYQEIFDGFTEKYGITINRSQDSASSQEEIDAAKKLKGQDTAPDTFDIGSSVAVANTEYFAPYKPAGFDDIPDAQKEKDGLWKVGYYGVMAVGYDANKIKNPPKTFDDLLKPEFKGAVALNGNPTQAAAAAGAVAYATLQNGGTLDDLSKGVEWFSELKKAGNWNAADGKPNTIASGETPVLLDWSFNQKGYATSDTIKGGGIDWKYTVLPGTAYVGYYNQAINKDAPHPAAARLWEEYLYSDAAQNAWLKGGAYPARVDAMEKAGTLNKDEFPGKLDDVAVMTDEQATKAGELLNSTWANAVG